jgi:hypothetical protein
MSALIVHKLRLGDDGQTSQILERMELVHGPESSAVKPLAVKRAPVKRDGDDLTNPLKLMGGDDLSRRRFERRIEEWTVHAILDLYVGLSRPDHMFSVPVDQPFTAMLGCRGQNFPGDGACRA